MWFQSTTSMTTPNSTTTTTFRPSNNTSSSSSSITTNTTTTCLSKRIQQHQDVLRKLQYYYVSKEEEMSTIWANTSDVDDADDTTTRSKRSLVVKLLYGLREATFALFCVEQQQSFLKQSNDETPSALEVNILSIYTEDLFSEIVPVLGYSNPLVLPVNLSDMCKMEPSQLGDAIQRNSSTSKVLSELFEGIDCVRFISVAKNMENLILRRQRDISGEVHAGAASSVEEEQIPFPLPFLINLTQGSPYAIATRYDIREYLKPGDKIRVYSVHKDIEWVVSEKEYCRSCFNSFRLWRPYDHNRITHEEHIHIPGHRSSIIDNEQDDSSKERTIKRKGDALSGLNVWKMIPKSTDKRQVWRRQYDDGDIPWENEFDKESGYVKRYGIKFRRCDLEELCKDAPCAPEESIHEQRVNYVLKVDPAKIMDEAFRAVCRWHPVGKSVDNVKWAKFARKMRFLPGVKNAKHEVDMAFFRQSSIKKDRKLNNDGFGATLLDLSLIQYPEHSHEDALALVLWNTVVMLPTVNTLLWKEAKRLALDEESRKICAQIRLATNYRRAVIRRSYIAQQRSTTYVAKLMRKVIARRREKNLHSALELDRMFRKRYVAACVMQREWRRYNGRRNFLLFKKDKRDKERTDRQIFLEKKRTKRQRRDSELVFKKIISVEGVLMTVTMWLRENFLSHQSNRHLDFQSYIYSTQETFRFVLEEDTLRNCMETALGKSGPLSWSEMMDQTALLKLINRLSIRVVSKRSIVIFRKKSITERGKLLVKVVKKVSNRAVIVYLYKAADEFIFQVYDPLTSAQMRNAIKFDRLVTWLDEVELMQKDVPIQYTPGKHLIKPENQQELAKWLISKLLIYFDSVTQDIVLKMQFEEDDTRKLLSATKLQSCWRMFQAQNIVRARIKKIFEKIYCREQGSYYYLNKITNVTEWVKPKLLEPEDLDDPKDEWRVEENISLDGLNKEKYYFNPATGQSSWLSEDQAARLVQRKFRSHEDSILFGQAVGIFEAAIALRFIKKTEDNYEHDHHKLTHLFNYALLNHCLRFNFSLAKMLYEEAMIHSPDHPIITRAYGIFLLASNGIQDIANVYDEPRRLFNLANELDPKAEMFESARGNFFQWAITCFPKHPVALLNYALLHQCVLCDYEKADKIYRRALDVDANNPVIKNNYTFFSSQRYPGGEFASSGPSVSVYKRSVLIEQRSEWGEWQLMMDPQCPRSAYKNFWYNKLSKTSSFYEPDWIEVTRARIHRSKLLKQNTTSSGWREYEDTRLGNKFTVNEITGKCM